jgi:hypothetical protein
LRIILVHKPWFELLSHYTGIQLRYFYYDINKTEVNFYCFFKLEECKNHFKIELFKHKQLNTSPTTNKD